MRAMSLPTPLVLVADDEPSMLELVARHLRTMKNPAIEVIEASDGEQAWSLAQEHLPDLVVLDVMMPGMSGWEVCRKIREDVSLAHTGVLMLTGIGENLNQLTSPLYGADAYIDKPFDFGELDEKVRTALEAREGQREGISRPRLNGVGGAALPAKRVTSKGAKKKGKGTKVKTKAANGSAKSTASTKGGKTAAKKDAKAAKKDAKVAKKDAKAAKKDAKAAKKVAAKAPVSKALASKAPATKKAKGAKKGAAAKSSAPKKAAAKASAKKGAGKAAKPGKLAKSVAPKVVAKASAKKGAAKNGAARATNGRSHVTATKASPAKGASSAAGKAAKAKPAASRKPAARGGKARATR